MPVSFSIEIEKNKRMRAGMINLGKTAVVKQLGKLEDGSVCDSTEGIDPLECVVGSGAVIDGFDEAVSSMLPGEFKSISVPPKQAYGEYDDSRVERGPMYAIPNAKDLQIGKRFYFVTKEGLRFPAVITEINEGIATIDYNHPLAGKTLYFDITLLQVKDETTTNIEFGVPFQPSSSGSCE